jgi:hypothetical protein
MNLVSVIFTAALFYYMSLCVLDQYGIDSFLLLSFFSKSDDDGDDI